MTFEVLHEGTECNCVDGVGTDTESTFLRTVGGNQPKERDFMSHWERYKKQGKEIEAKGCADTCGWKGVSMNKADGYDEEEIITVFRQRLMFSPQSKMYICRFKTGSENGVVNHTPNDDHDSHHDLLKCDVFSVEKLESVSVVKIELEDDAD
ncbi:hypothetical protein J7E24_13840 [Hymenobacter sp. ISL-91]|uniref:hypothetical protein n=1 Tax=Hymenobacter sp. ISL-91 TaxID=2819151 RepID=UPI001BEAB252|nr:hypothetical protein [Hymenobacter sp. ISL-91]MBT2558873.1 hypothetical protein [Hymenobacter sp. ISL-91]